VETLLAMRTRVLIPIIAVIALAAPSAAWADFPHVVTPGESLSSIASTDGLTVEELAAANGLSSDAQLVTGSTLMIPPHDGGASSGGASVDSSSGSSSRDASSGSSSGGGSSSSSSSDGTYVVQPGDTLTSIAENAGTTVAKLAAANGLDPDGILRDGTSLQVSGGSGAAADSSSSQDRSSGTSNQIAVDAPPYPTAEHVSASEVSSIADANGVPPSLAEAIGWQESGFNNDLVSSADARGVMQILPGTWDYIQRNLTPGDPLAPASASENVRGGVLLLHNLLDLTGGDPSLAAAGYYQGLQSVRQNGLYNDTQQYVNSVMALRQRFGGG
jgi:N-acetylmuramoyl-L-alanine amidase